MIWRYPNFRKHHLVKDNKNTKLPRDFCQADDIFELAPRDLQRSMDEARARQANPFLDFPRYWTLNKGYPFSHNRSGKWPSPKWKERIILEIHPFSTEQWLWEEGILSLRTNKHQGHLKNGGWEDEGFLFSGAEGKPENSGANLLLVSGSVWWWWKEIPSIGLNLSLKARHLGVGCGPAPSLWQWRHSSFMVNLMTLEISPESSHLEGHPT